MLRILIVATFSFILVSPAQAGGRLLFDGLTLEGWTTLQGDPVTTGWQAEDGVLHLPAGKKGGHIITDRDYTDFVLDFDFKISPGGNSGIKYRVRDFDGRTLGCEFQILDDGADKYAKLAGNKLTGGLYDIYEPAPTRFMRGTSEFNRGRIVVRGQRIEHWLNGRRIVCAIVGSPEWQARVALSKFKSVDGFGANRSGRIMLTDHNNEVWYRNVVIYECGQPCRLRCQNQSGLERLFGRREQTGPFRQRNQANVSRSRAMRIRADS